MSLRVAYRAGLAELARNWIAQRPLYLASAATGSGPADELLEIAILEHDGEPLIDTRIRPAQPPPPAASARLGRSDVDLQQAPGFGALAPTLARHLAGRALVIYDAAWHLRLLLQSAHRHGCPQPPARSAFCAQQLFAAWHNDWDGEHYAYRRQPLASAAVQLGLALDTPLEHAHSRAALTRQLMHALADAPLDPERSPPQEVA
jgi:DNA polymerase-3 subunit epsilon